jgi:hypothetical protein
MHLIKAATKWECAVSRDDVAITHKWYTTGTIVAEVSGICLFFVRLFAVGRKMILEFTGFP